MKNFDLCEIIQPEQIWEGKEIRFDPDSSPEAWKYYKDLYASITGIGDKYNLGTPVFRSYDSRSKYKIEGIPAKYKDCVDDNRKFQRLVALIIDEEHCEKSIISPNGDIYYSASSRLGGETDFNFNEEKYAKFLKVLSEDFFKKFEVLQKEHRNKVLTFNMYTRHLEKQVSQFYDVFINLQMCKAMHHSVNNFSLMQVMGNMQEIKGSDPFDRIDTFIFNLDKYFSGDEKIEKIFQDKAGYNIIQLDQYLSTFSGIYDYCEKIYLINDSSFVDALIDSGGKPMESKEDVIRYIKLAKSYWEMKQELIDKVRTKVETSFP